MKSIKTLISDSLYKNLRNNLYETNCNTFDDHVRYKIANIIYGNLTKISEQLQTRITIDTYYP
jgi:hypothetical protein